MLLFAQLSAALFVLAPKPEGFDHLALLVVDILRAARASGGSDVHIFVVNEAIELPVAGPKSNDNRDSDNKSVFQEAEVLHVLYP